ncbi:MAG: DUF4430 domain-containing protein [archaeon]|nr:DUF4430 domain-containing protein [archaeon]
MKKLIAATLLLLVAFSGCLTAITERESTGSDTTQFYVKGIDAKGQLLFEAPVIAQPNEGVFDALKKSGVPIEYDDTAYGPFVTGIGSIKAGEGEYLALYVDGEYAQTGIADIKPERDMRVEFRIEKIQ